MKQFVLSVFVLVTIAACAKKVAYLAVPQPVQTEFINRYTDVKDLTWRKKKDIYTAKFVVEGRKMRVDFSPSGEVLAVD
jgi:hypothetical protein